MTPTITIEIPAASEALVRQLLALHEELQALALSAPDGTVLNACEEAVIPKGRDLTANLLADADAWSKRIGSLGVGADTQVVVYDDNHAKDAARVWWILRYWGVKDVRLLNGGWVGWDKGKHPTDKTDAVIKSSEFKAVAATERMATKDELLKSLSGGKFQIVDARSEGEFCGTDALKNKRAGAIPGSKQLEWIDLLDKDTHRFKSPDELKKLFDAAGVKLDRPTATHCQSGGRAAVMAYGLELMGAKDERNYYKSWSEWGNADDTPVV